MSSMLMGLGASGPDWSERICGAGAEPVCTGVV